MSDETGRTPPTTDASDPHDLGRFVVAQSQNYAQALDEIRRGSKQTHWMWYVFPQFAGLGFSPMATRYAIQSQGEAEAYLRHPLLGPRLEACCEAALGVKGRTAHQIFGSPDDMKLRSCATLFAHVSPEGSVFHQLLARFYEGQPDANTLRLLKTHNRGGA